MNAQPTELAVDHIDQIIELCTAHDFRLGRHDGAREGKTDQSIARDTLCFDGHEQLSEHITKVDLMLNVYRSTTSNALFRIMPNGKNEFEHVTVNFTSLDEFRAAFEKFLKIVDDIDRASEEGIAKSSGLRFFVIDQLKPLLALSQ